MKISRFGKPIAVAALIGILALPAVAFAGRSGGSFGGRGGFRSGGGFSSPSRSYSRSGGGGTNFVVMPSFGWGMGWGGMGWGGGGMGLMGTLMLVAVVGIGAVAVARAVRRVRGGADWSNDGDDEIEERPSRGYIYKIQIAFGRSARGIQDRLAKFAEEGDTASEAGLAQLLQQTTVEILRAKDSIRYAGVDASGPMSLTNAETKMNGITLGERSRFQIERVRGADGRVRRSTEVVEESKGVIEYVIVTLVVATRSALAVKQVSDLADVDTALAELGGISPTALLGLEVIWTPADPSDSMSESDLITLYPELRSL